MGSSYPAFMSKQTEIFEFDDADLSWSKKSINGLSAAGPADRQIFARLFVPWEKAR